MEARRFSRINSLHTAAPDDPQGERSGGPRGKVDVRQSGASFPQGGDTESPAWQEYFFLAPNVRFTRTPDYEPKHRQPQDEVAGQDDPQELPTQQVGPGVVMHRGPAPAGSAQPARSGETAKGVAPSALKAPATARAATRPAPVVGN